MKKQLQIEAVANGFLAREPLHDGIAFSPENSFVFSDAAALGRWVAGYFGGSVPVPAEPGPTEEQMWALQPGDVVVLNTGERSTVTENDGTRIPIRTDRRSHPRDETQWFHSDGRLRCATEDGPDAHRIVKIEKKSKL